MNKAKQKKRVWGFPVEWRNGKVTKIELYHFEKVELARHNIAACKAVSK